MSKKSFLLEEFEGAIDTRLIYFSFVLISCLATILALFDRDYTVSISFAILVILSLVFKKSLYIHRIVMYVEMPDKQDYYQNQIKSIEFLFGILFGVTANILAQSIMNFIGIKQGNSIYWIILSFVLFFVLFSIYRRIMGLPSFIEFECKFSPNTDFSIHEFETSLKSSCRKFIHERKWFWIDIWQLRSSMYIGTLKKISKFRVSRTKFGKNLACIFVYRKIKKITFRITIPKYTISHINQELIDCLKSGIRELDEKKHIIKITSDFSPEKYYHAHILYPIFDKGREIPNFKNQ